MASGLVPQQAEPLLARALSYLAIDKPREAAADLDEAVQDDPQNAQAWLIRGLAYPRRRQARSGQRYVLIRKKSTASR